VEGWYEKLRVPCGALAAGIFIFECSSAGAAEAPAVQHVAAWVQHDPLQAAWAAAVAPNNTAISERVMVFTMSVLLRKKGLWKSKRLFNQRAKECANR
jgi:hypothetical protein